MYFLLKSNFTRKATVCLLSFISICAESNAVGMVIIMQTEFPERYITLGLKIAYYRKKAGLTQEVLAERIGKSVNFVGQVEGTGTIRGVSLETLFKIAQVLKIPPSKLLEDD